MLHLLTCEVKKFKLKIIFLSAQIDGSAKCQQMGEKIVKKFEGRTGPLISPIPKVPAAEIIHWVVADRSLEQVYAPFMQGELSDLIYRNYAWVYEYLKNGNVQANGMFYVATEEITIFGRHAGPETIMAAAGVGCRPGVAQRLFDILNAFINEKKEVIFDVHLQKFPE
jgi:hypothetical protein